MKVLYCCLLISMLLLGLLNHFNIMNDAILLNLRFEQTTISNGDYWRLLSGHIVHLNLPHTLMNIGALSLLMIMFWKDISYPIDLIALIFSTIGINIGLFFFHPELSSYAGFSGVLHGLFLFYFLKTFPENNKASVIAITVIGLKIIWEQTPWADNSETAALIGGSVATMSHLYGGICGLLAGISYLFVQRNKPRY